MQAKPYSIQSPKHGWSWETPPDPIPEEQIDETLEPIDLSYFFGQEADSVRVDPVLYPDRAVIERCALEHDWGDDTDKLLAMWSRVKGNNASVSTMVVLLAAAALLVVWMISRRNRKRRRRR